MERSSGILLPVFSLPSPYGIGTLGKPARTFVDFLEKSGQRWWQMLPLGPTGYGDSPYQSFSSFAGNPYFIDPGELLSDGLLLPSEVAAICESYAEDTYVDYGRLYAERVPLLRRAARRGLHLEESGFTEFCAKERKWLDDYALFTTLKTYFDEREWRYWPEAFRHREASAMESFRDMHADEIAEIKYIQFLFFRQFSVLRQYAAKRNVGFIGDIPFYAALDSADVWARQNQFELSADGSPSAVAGVPPDAFSEDGQLWGNPLYDWASMSSDGFSWWRDRIAAAVSRCDMLRLDHFRAVESYWAVPAGAATARQGIWRPGPAMQFVECLNRSFPHMRFLAEDLGILTHEVEALRDASGWPGMKVLQFAFEEGGTSRYLPRPEPDRTVCYTGTHDNETMRSWAETLSVQDELFARRFLTVASDGDLADAVLCAGIFDGAEIFISRIQDWLSLDDSARINTPGTTSGNWRWRLRGGMLSSCLARRILELTRAAGRAYNPAVAEFT